MPTTVPSTPKSRLPLALTLTGAAALGYYFYTVGAAPKPHHETGPAEHSLTRVGSAVDRNVEEGKQRISAGVQRFDETTEKTKQGTLGKIDEADRKIEQETAKAKGGIMSWFGMGK